MDKFKVLASTLYNWINDQHSSTGRRQRRLRSFFARFGIYNCCLCVLVLGLLAVDCLVTSFTIQLTIWTIVTLAMVELLRPIIFDPFSSIVSQLFRTDVQSSTSSSSDVEQLRHIDEDDLSVGKCLAYSFYENYLKHVLPGLHNRVEFCEEHCSSSSVRADERRRRLVIAKKLIVLVPYSGNVEGYRLVTDADSAVETFRQLEPVTLTIAGQPSRNYVNTVYHLKNTDVYCVCEFATPLVSLHRMWMSSGATDDQALRRQILAFCTKLRHILRANQCEIQDACEIVLYRDLQTGISLADILAKTASRIQSGDHN